jgi:hypothetical protein
MSYKMKAEDWETITPIAQQLASLKPYASLTLKDESESLDRLRYIIYAWLYETGQKPHFKLIRKGKEQLEIMRKGSFAPELVITDKIGDFVRDNLIELEDEADVSRRIREAMSGNLLSIEEGTRALTEWQRAQGKPISSV